MTQLPEISGFLVPPVDGRAIKASTFSFAKWAWVRQAGAAAGLVHLRTSLGRHREEAVLQRSDDELVALSLADLADAVGLTARPVDTHVQRWGGGLPQYAVGHLDRVARIRAAVAEVAGLAVCGAAYDGVGIPAVIASARSAVASCAPCRPSLPKMFAMWLSTVLTVTNRRSAIAVLERPSAIRASTSRSRSVSAPAGRAAAAHQVPDDLGVEHRAAGGNGVQGVDQRRRRR